MFVSLGVGPHLTKFNHPLLTIPFMRKQFLAAVALSALLFGSSQASAQIAGGGVLRPEDEGGFLIGPIGGLNVVSYNTGAFPMIQSEADCFTAQNGSGIAPWGGITAALPLGVNMQNFVIGEVIFDSRSGKFTAENSSAARPPVQTKKDGVEAEGLVETAASADLSYLLINLAYKYNFVEGPSPVGPGIQIGPSIGMKLSSKINKDITIRASSGNQANPQKVDNTTATDEITDAETLRIAIRGMATYDIPFNQSWIATPVVGYDFPVTKVDKSRDWTAQGIFAGVAFRYFIKG